MKRTSSVPFRGFLVAAFCAGLIAACDKGLPYDAGVDGAAGHISETNTGGAGGQGGARADANVAADIASTDAGDAMDVAMDVAPEASGDSSTDLNDAPVDKGDVPVESPPASDGGDGKTDGADGPCDGPTCTALAQGQRCSNALQCATGSCVEGVCCDKACTAKCTSCVNVNTDKPDGTCAAVKATVEHGNDCTVSPPGMCGTTGACDGAGDCLKWPAQTLCTSAVCSADGQNATKAAKCNGAGACVPGGFEACLTYACDTAAGACKTTCTADADCSSGWFCYNKVCGKKPEKAICNASVGCASGNCGGRCCAPADTSCFCPQPSPWNLLQNAGFDTAVTPAWTINIVPGSNNAVTWSSADATGCPYSGSAQLFYDNTDGQFLDAPSITQCVPASPNTDYLLGARFQSSCLTSWCNVYFFTGTNCTGSDATAALAMPENGGPTFTDWMDAAAMSGPGAHSALVTCTSAAPIGAPTCATGIDAVYLSASPHTY